MTHDYFLIVILVCDNQLSIVVVIVPVELDQHPEKHRQARTVFSAASSQSTSASAAVLL